MSDKVIRITSQQGFADQFTNAAPATSLNLCDFTISAGLNVNLSKSYIAFNTIIENTAGEIVNASNWLDVDNAEIFNVPNAALVRNCHISSSNVGNIESIRRQDTLACGMWNLNNTAEERKNDMNTLASYDNGAGVGIHTTYGLDNITNNVTPDGSTIVTNASGQPLTSTQVARDIKVPLKDLFGIGMAEDWDTSVWGETRIHLETNWSKVLAKQWGGDEDTAKGFDTTTAQGAIVAQTVQPAADVGIIELDNKHGEWEYTCPFFVGQKVIITATTPTGLSEERTITSIQFQLDNTANPATGNNAVYIQTDTPFYTNATGTAVTLVAPLMKAKVNDANLRTTVRSAELVLFVNDGETSSSREYDFKTFTSEEDNGNALTSFNRGYMVEGNAENLFVASCNNNAILPNGTITSYRYSLDNVAQTGNRDVDMATATKQGSPLQYDRLLRCLDRSAQLPFRNAQLLFYKADQPQADVYASPTVMICETLEVKPSNKMVNLEITSTGLNQIILYKQIPRNIRV